MKIEMGAAIFKAEFKIPTFLRTVAIELRVENEFLKPEMDTIKAYLSKCLKCKMVEVEATIRCQGSEVVSVAASSETVAAITSDLFGAVNQVVIREGLRKTVHENKLVTVDDLFKSVKNSGLNLSDRQFMNELMKMKGFKHSEHMEYLSSQHLYDLMRLRMQAKPFAFICLLSGKRGYYFVLESVNKQDATYLWRVEVSEAEAMKNPSLLRTAFLQVEEAMSWIRAEGRNPYRNAAPDNFTFIEHDYQSDDGFLAWKNALHRVLDGEDAINLE
jgi:hypothetical protein